MAGPTFLLRIQLVDAEGSPLPEVPVRPFAIEADGLRAAIGEVQLSNGEGMVELDVTGNAAVAGSHLPSIQLRHADTGQFLAEQWIALLPGDPFVLDYGVVRAFGEPVVSLPDRELVGLPISIVEALDASAQLADLQNQLASTQDQLASTQDQLASVQGQLVSVQAERDVAVDELAELQSQLGTPSSLDTMVESVGTQLKATQQALVSNDSPFQLGKVSLSLKVVPSGGGTSFGFATLDQLASVGGESLSTLSLEFAQTATGSAPPPADVAVPSLHGHTEPGARRLLTALGLGTSVVHQALPDDGDVALAGRVLKQIPGAGAPLAPGQVVTLVLGKALAGAAP